MNSRLRLRPATVRTAVVVVAVLALPRAEAADELSLADQLRQLGGRVLPAEGELAKQLPGMLARHAHDGLRAANERETRAWRGVKTRADWERYRAWD